MVPGPRPAALNLYQSDLARLLLGETLHPGGLALTNRLGRLMGIQRDDWVADLASGRGCQRDGGLPGLFTAGLPVVEFSHAATAGAAAASRATPVAAQAFFLQGDAENRPPGHLQDSTPCYANAR